jgi:hypothetical protein
MHLAVWTSITLPAPFASLPCWCCLFRQLPGAVRHCSPTVEATNTRKMETQQLTSTELSQFNGTENWYRHPVVRKMLYTDGVRFMMNKAGAYWLIDEIAFQQYHPRVKCEEFQVWILNVDLEKSTGALHCEDGNGRVLCSKQIPFTDFPLDKVKIFVSENVILLPSEN